MQQLKEQDPVARQKLELEIALKVRDTPFGTLQGIARRIIMDLGKGPPYNENKCGSTQARLQAPGSPGKA
jgi:hypothetical protein